MLKLSRKKVAAVLASGFAASVMAAAPAQAATLTLYTDTMPTSFNDNLWCHNVGHGLHVSTGAGRERIITVTNRTTGRWLSESTVRANTKTNFCYAHAFLSGSDDLTIRVQEVIPFLPDPVATGVMNRSCGGLC